MLSEIQSTVLLRPSSKEVVGDHPNNSLAFLLSHHNLSTSLFGGLIRDGSETISTFFPIKEIIFSARVPIDI